MADEVPGAGGDEAEGDAADAPDIIGWLRSHAVSAVLHRFAEKLGFADRMFKNITMVKGKYGMEPEAESILREINRGGWSTGYCGQSPERLKAHMANQDKFDLVTLRAKPDAPWGYANGSRGYLREADLIVLVVEARTSLVPAVENALGMLRTAYAWWRRTTRLWLPRTIASGSTAK